MYTDNRDKGQSHNSRVDGSPTTIRKDDPADILLLSESEQRQLAAWNANQQRYPLDNCVQQLVEKQAAIRPDAVALVAGNQILRYEDIDRRANQLAQYLRASGIGPNTSVTLRWAKW